MMRKTKNRELAKKTEPAPSGELDIRRPFSLFDDWDRWFDSFRKDFESRFWGPVALSQGETALSRTPLVDLVDAGKEFVVKAELPGVEKEDLDVRVTPDSLEIRAVSRREKKEDGRDYYFRERAYSSFERVLPFPEDVLADRAGAELKDGVLEVRVPKKVPTTPQEPVKVPVR
jgi:HSP20 family protein